MSAIGHAAGSFPHHRPGHPEYDVSDLPSQQPAKANIMTSQLTIRQDGRSSGEFQAGASALFVLLLTSVHHAWGAWVFDTPWRLHIVFISVPVAMVIAALLAVSKNDVSGWGRPARWAAAIVILGFPIAMIGFWEGGFNHLVKNLVFFTQGEAATRSLFPSPAVEMPSDLVFEITGVLQFPAALHALRKLVRLVRQAG